MSRIDTHFSNKYPISFLSYQLILITFCFIQKVGSIISVVGTSSIEIMESFNCRKRVPYRLCL